jgi:hypothetical protein
MTDQRSRRGHVLLLDALAHPCHPARHITKTGL